MGLLKPAFNGFFKTKKILLYLISITITLGLVIFLIYNLYLLNKIYANKIKNNVLNRILYVSKSEVTELDIENLYKIENIEYVYRELNIFSMKMNNEMNVVIKYGSELEIPKLTLGNGFVNNSSLQVILPSKILDSNNKYIYLDSYLGKNVNLNLEDYNVEVYVAGIYDNINSNYVYINTNFKDDLIKYNKDIETSTILSVIVDDYKNVDETITNLIDNYGYNANIRELSGQSDIKIYNLASLLIFLTVILIIVFMYISIGIIIEGIVSDEKKDIAILKAIGYNKKHISKIIMYRIMAILTISFIIGIFVSLFFNITIGKLIENRLEITIEQNYKIYFIVYTILIVLVYLVAVLTVKLNNKKIKKISAIELLKDN